jgi:diketogulonate reductase-like aldo/keto reductase
MISRRTVLQAGLAAASGLHLPVAQAATTPITRRIPSSGEQLPVIGMGTSRTFDVGSDPAARARLAEVMTAFFAGGGTLIDSSPMYGSAEEVVGDLLRAAPPKQLFAATKVWSDGRDAGIAQMNASMQKMNVARMDLMQVHNLRDWRTQLATLREWHAAGRIRYLGITTSTSRQYEDFAAVMRSEKLDFVQLNYSPGEREAEQVLLPLARDRGMATLINRPFMRSELFRRVAGKPLPGWAKEIDCESWGQLFLKWILGHPAVTCIIPASSKAANMADNMRAGFGALPDEGLRQRLVADLGLA